MKKKVIFLFSSLLFIYQSYVFGQSISVKYPSGSAIGTPLNNQGANTPIELPPNTPVKAIFLKVTGLTSGHKLAISTIPATSVTGTPLTPDGNDQKIDFLEDIAKSTVKIVETDASNAVVSGVDMTISFIEKKPESKDNNASAAPSVNEYIAQNYAQLVEKPYGLIDPNDKEVIVHLFFDRFGNSVLDAIPQGISNAQYKVHIIYPVDVANADKISYSVKQKSGSFSSSLLFNNTGILKAINDNSSFHGGKEGGPNAITERSFLLGTATDDLTFDITATSEDAEGKPVKAVLETYTIKMSSVYHGTFDVGFVSSNLPNPTFNLVDDPTGTTKVIKETDKSPRGMVTVMASFYTSPVILFEKYILRKKIANYKLTGRNFLDDHKIYERFYPVVGVSINSKTFENIFYGVNWEVARGLCIFYGWHHGKVNTFEMPDYAEGVTPVTQQQFDFYTNTKWKTSTVVGVSLDILVVRNLFLGFN